MTPQQRTDLIETALAMRERAYAPYSRYRVGGAVLGRNGTIYPGCNVENASYGLCNCAERTAIFSMVADGCREALAVAVATENSGSPCGACRQVLVEFAGDIPVLLLDGAGTVRETTLYALLPDHFGPEHLPQGA
jgi:cytidine deaminase